MVNERVEGKKGKQDLQDARRIYRCLARRDGQNDSRFIDGITYNSTKYLSGSLPKGIRRKEGDR